MYRTSTEAATLEIRGKSSLSNWYHGSRTAICDSWTHFPTKWRDTRRCLLQRLCLCHRKGSAPLRPNLDLLCDRNHFRFSTHVLYDHSSHAAVLLWGNLSNIDIQSSRRRTYSLGVLHSCHCDVQLFHVRDDAEYWTQIWSSGSRTSLSYQLILPWDPSRNRIVQARLRSQNGTSNAATARTSCRNTRSSYTFFFIIIKE